MLAREVGGKGEGGKRVRERCGGKGAGAPVESGGGEEGADRWHVEERQGGRDVGGRETGRERKREVEKLKRRRSRDSSERKREVERRGR